MARHNSFVLTLDDGQSSRWKRFASKNSVNGGTNHTPPVTRVDGWRWIVDNHQGDSDGDGRLRSEKQQLQEEYERRYPFLKDSARHRRYGDAGCTLGHVRILEQFCCHGNGDVGGGDDDDDDGDDEYIFVFEDDVQLLPPLIDTYQVLAPADAHVVHLVAYATKVVPVPFYAAFAAAGHNRDGEHPDGWMVANRVIQGYGAQGYVITKTGARNLLQHLERHSDPADVGLTGSSSLRVYQPMNGFPLVRHLGGTSDRRSKNT
jgi:hypothetical protein